MSEISVLEGIFQTLPHLKDQHSPQSAPYQFLKKIVDMEIEKLFSDSSMQKKSFGPFGSLIFPHFKMGTISSPDLFVLDELILFSFYWINQSRYKKVLDIGANIGLHSIILSRCGFEVQLFEPDPVHFGKMEELFKWNEIRVSKAHRAAVSDKKGEAEFVRVLGNTTSSHLAGCKQPYGDLERFQVPILNIRDFIGLADLIKMDVEGHENTIILATTVEDWEKTDALIEIGSKENATQIFHHLQKIGVNSFSQKIGWRKVKKLEDMPTSYRDGSLFISSKKEMPWI